MDSIVVIPLYRHDQYGRWHELFSDFMFDTFEEWVKKHAQLVQKFKVQGDIVHEIEIDVDDYLSWTRSTGKAISNETRMTFTNIRMYERRKEAGDFDAK
jgi:hypothetical protein